MKCLEALRFLQNLPLRSRSLIKSLNLERDLMFAHCDNRDHATKLGEFLVRSMRLENVTLAVPNDMEAGTYGKDEGQYKWFI